MSKDIKTIINYLDTYLIKTGLLSIGPVEANAVLANAGLLLDSKDRPGKPLRNLLREGQLPHAFQSGGKGSSWTIPHSNQHTSKYIQTDSSATKNERSTHKTANVLSADNLQRVNFLMNEWDFKSAGSIDNLVPHDAGLYCIRVSDIDKLPKPFNTILSNRQHNIIYIGIASESLKSRFFDQELRAKGHGTFFRSIGAVLGFRPPKGSLITKANKYNYKFSLTDEEKIIMWINDNLIVNWVKINGDLESLETGLLSKYRPLINIAKNPSALQLITDMRTECVKVANQL